MNEQLKADAQALMSKLEPEEAAIIQQLIWDLEEVVDELNGGDDRD